MPNVNITVRMDENLKAQAEDLFSDFGLSMSSAFVMFTKQAIREQRIPFEIKREPNQATLQAMNEVADMKANPHNYKSYDSASEMMEDILG
ncbi:MAG: type II toxin-antitoxin system RelB/DinJ family antitoxin [Bacillota bacterium]